MGGGRTLERWSPVGGLWSPGVCPQREWGIPAPSSSSLSLPYCEMNGFSATSSVTTGLKAKRPTNHGLEYQKLWAKVKTFSLYNLIISGNFTVTDS